MIKDIEKIQAGDFVIFDIRDPIYESVLFGLSIKKIAITGLFLHILKKLE